MRPFSQIKAFCSSAVLEPMDIFMNDAQSITIPSTLAAPERSAPLIRINKFVGKYFDENMRMYQIPLASFQHPGTRAHYNSITMQSSVTAHIPFHSTNTVAPASNLAGIVEWVRHYPLVTLQALLNIIDVNVCQWWFDDRHANTNTTPFPSFVLTRCQGSETTRAVVIIVVPPGLMSLDNFRAFTDLDAVRDPKMAQKLAYAGIDDGPSLTELVWANVFALCTLKTCARFAITSYDQWVFGEFSESGNEFSAEVSSVKAHSSESPTILETLVAWARAPDFRDVGLSSVASSSVVSYKSTGSYRRIRHQPKPSVPSSNSSQHVLSSESSFPSTPSTPSSPRNFPSRLLPSQSIPPSLIHRHRLRKGPSSLTSASSSRASGSSSRSSRSGSSHSGSSGPSPTSRRRRSSSYRRLAAHHTIRTGPLPDFWEAFNTPEEEANAPDPADLGQHTVDLQALVQLERELMNQEDGSDAASISAIAEDEEMDGPDEIDAAVQPYPKLILTDSEMEQGNGVQLGSAWASPASSLGHGAGSGSNYSSAPSEPWVPEGIWPSGDASSTDQQNSNMQAYLPYSSSSSAFSPQVIPDSEPSGFSTPPWVVQPSSVADLQLESRVAHADEQSSQDSQEGSDNANRSVTLSPEPSFGSKNLSGFDHQYYWDGGVHESTPSPLSSQSSSPSSSSSGSDVSSPESSSALSPSSCPEVYPEPFPSRSGDNAPASSMSRRHPGPYLSFWPSSPPGSPQTPPEAQPIVTLDQISEYHSGQTGNDLDDGGSDVGGSEYSFYPPPSDQLSFRSEFAGDEEAQRAAITRYREATEALSRAMPMFPSGQQQVFEFGWPDSAFVDEQNAQSNADDDRRSEAGWSEVSSAQSVTSELQRAIRRIVRRHVGLSEDEEEVFEAVEEERENVVEGEALE